jgi:hypothetical protein
MPPTLQHSLNYSSLRSVHISPKWALRKCPLESSSSTKQNPSPRPSDDAYEVETLSYWSVWFCSASHMVVLAGIWHQMDSHRTHLHAFAASCDYGRTMRDWVLFSPFVNSVRRKSKNPRESGRPELRSKASRKTKTSAFKASLSCRRGSPISWLSSS